MEGAIKMNSPIKTLFSLTVLLCATTAQAAEVTFSNVFVGGSLATGATFSTTMDGIDFTLPNARVSDDPHAAPLGNVTIGYVADSTEPMTGDQLMLDSLDLAGSGTVLFHETIIDIQDAFNPVLLASFEAVLNGPFAGPLNANLDFSGNPTTRIFVIKSIALTSFDFNMSAPDFAAIASVQQSFQFIPEPATILLFVSGMALLLYLESRRNGKSAPRA